MFVEENPRTLKEGERLGDDMEHTPKGSVVLDRMLALSTDSQVTAPCGCELFRSGHDGKSVTFRYCDTHAAAPALLEALKKALQWIDAVISEPDKALISRDLGHRIEREANTAIKAAKGDA